MFPKLFPALKSILSLQFIATSRNALPLLASRRGLGCHSASITKIHRAVYSRVYPTIVVLPDGSSIRIRYHEPRKIIKLPLDLSKLSEEEKRLRLERRKPRKKLTVVEEIEDNYNANEYLTLIKK